MNTLLRRHISEELLSVTLNTKDSFTQTLHRDREYDWLDFGHHLDRFCDLTITKWNMPDC